MNAPSIRALIPAITIALVLLAGQANANSFLFVVTTDFQVSGNCTEIEIDSPWNAEAGLEQVSGDAIVREHGGLLYVVNRYLADNVQVIDPAANYLTIHENSVGPGSNPQDIVVLNENRAYISRYESTWLYEFDPATGSVIDSIDLSLFADGDGLPEMSRMALDGDHLFVQLQRLDRNFFWTPVSPSYLAVIDISTNQLVDTDHGQAGIQAISLAGTNPGFPMTRDESSRKLYVSELGSYGSLDGGIDVVDLDQLVSLGFVSTETQLGGDVGAFVIAGGKGFAVTSDDAFFTNDFVSFSLATGAILGTHYSTSGFVPDVEYDNTSGQIFLCDRKTTAPGIQVFDGTSGAQLTGSPISTGLPPFDLVVVQPEDVGVAGASETETLLPELAPRAYPNPFRSSTEIRFQIGRNSSGGTSTTVAIYTAEGRLVRMLTTRKPAQSAFASIRWDGRTGAGRQAAAGLYLFRVIDAARSTESTGRVTLIR